MKKPLSIILAALMLLTAFSVTAAAADSPNLPLGGDGDMAGENCEWSWSSLDKTLRISGTGAMYDFDFDYSFPGWYNHRWDIEKIVIEDGITKTGDYSFYGLENVTEVEIADSVREISCCSFADCSALQTVTLPKDLETLETFAFYGCDSLVQINISENDKFYSVDGNLYSESGGTKSFVLYAPGRSSGKYTILSDTAKIEDGAFAGAKKLESVTIPNKVKEIGKGAFEYCQSLKSITIPNSVTSLGQLAFYCSGLTSVKLGSGIKSIPLCAFKCCSSLKSVTVPDGVKTIGDEAFYDCGKLSSVILGNSLETIGECAFENTSFKSVYLPKNVKTIGQYAFGYTYDSAESKHNSKSGFKLYCAKGTKAATSAKAYKASYGIPYTYVTVSAASLNAGASKALKTTAGTAKSFISNKKSVAAVKNGKVYALKKGTAVITATLKDGAKVTGKITVKSNPKLSKSSLTVTKGKTASIKITGKCPLVDNVYTNTAAAKVISGKTASVIKIKGLQTGSTTLKIKVNGVRLSLKVKVN